MSPVQTICTRRGSGRERQRAARSGKERQGAARSGLNALISCRLLPLPAVGCRSLHAMDG